MSAYKFEESIAWQKARDLAVLVYSSFGASKDYGFRDQITRAAVSVSNNIAEGFERGTDQELQHFLYIARGSCGEVRSMLHLALKLGYLSAADFEKIEAAAVEASKLVYSLIKHNK